MKWNWEATAYKDTKDSSGWNGYILLILSIGMSYYKGGYNAQALMCNQVLIYPPNILIT